MKKLKLNFLVLLIISIFMVACRSESFITEENTEISIPKTGEYILKEAPLFKQFLLNNVTNKASTNKNNVVLNDDRPVFIVYKENAVSYSTIVKNVNESSFNVWVYTIGEDKETFFSAEYIPKSSIINNDLNHFTGTVNYRSIDGSLLGTIKFINGEPKNKSTMTVTGENGKVSTCSLLIISTPVSCTSPEHHMPWDTCYETGSNRPYYETEIHKICTESQFPNIGLDGGGGYGGGGNSSGSEPAAEISIQDVFNMQLMQSNYPELTPEQYSYIENNQYIGGQILGYFGWNLTDNYHQLAMWCIDYLRENNNFNLSEYKAFKKIEDFINFGQQFFSDNPNTTWAEFENWFLEAPVINDLQNELIDDWSDPTRVKPTSRFKNQAKLNSIYNKVKTAANFKQYLQNFEPTFSVAHLMFDIGACDLATSLAETSWPTNYWIKITFNQDKNWANIPKIVIADTFMHEMIHAEIFRKLLSLVPNSNGTLDESLIKQYVSTHNYPGLFDYYVRKIYGEETWQHQAMAAHYVDIMVNFLKQIYGTTYTMTEYKTVVWMGLQGTKAWFLLPESERELYETTWKANYWLWEL